MYIAAVVLDTTSKKEQLDPSIANTVVAIMQNLHNLKGLSAILPTQGELDIYDVDIDRYRYRCIDVSK